MIINKIHKNQNQKESSSLPNQKKFTRRADITPAIRFSLGLAGLGREYRNARSIKEICASYNISHEFLYSLSRTLRQKGLDLFSPPNSKESTDLDKLLDSIQFYLETKMETQGALYGLSRLGQSFGIPYHSINFISQAIQTVGNCLKGTLNTEQAIQVTYLCDEVYSGGCPILVTIEAQSMAVLDIKRLDTSLSQQDWEQSWLRLSANDIHPIEVVKDQGVAMQAAVGVLPAETLILPDSFHAVPHRLGIIAAQLSRQVDKAIENEWKRKSFLDKAKTSNSQAKQMKKYQEACLETLQAIDELEWFNEHYFKIIQQFRPFTSLGEPRSITAASLKVKQSIEALRLLTTVQISKALDYIENLLDKKLLFKFLEKIPALYQQLGEIVCPETQWLWALLWQWQKKARQTHSPKVQQYAKQQMGAAKELLEEHYSIIAGGQAPLKMEEQTYLAIFPKVMLLLEQIVQSSALVETFNSILKPFINSARGQVSQPLLNLVMFYHNHRQFQRGVRQGKAPIELLTGNVLEQSWIEILMDKVKNKFQQLGINSLKKLHQLSNTQLPIEQKQVAMIRHFDTPIVAEAIAKVA